MNFAITSIRVCIFLVRSVITFGTQGNAGSAVLYSKCSPILQIPKRHANQNRTFTEGYYYYLIWYCYCIVCNLYCSIFFFTLFHFSLWKKVTVGIWNGRLQIKKSHMIFIYILSILMSFFYLKFDELIQVDLLLSTCSTFRLKPNLFGSIWKGLLLYLGGFFLCQ